MEKKKKVTSCVFTEKGSGTEGKRTYEVKKLEKEKSVVRTEGRGEGV